MHAASVLCHQKNAVQVYSCCDTLSKKFYGGIRKTTFVLSKMIHPGSKLG